MEVVSNSGCGDVRAKWNSVTAALLSMQANLAELERQLAETLAIVEGEPKPASDTEVMEAVPSIESGESQAYSESIDEASVAPPTEIVASTADDSAPTQSEVITRDEVLGESLVELRPLLATQPPTATEDVAEQEAASSTAVSVIECDDITVSRDEPAPQADDGNTMTDAPAEVENVVAIAEGETGPSAGMVATHLEAEATVTQPEDDNVVSFPNRRRRWLRPLAASAAACLALWAGLILNNPDALLTLASLGRVASDR